MPISSRFGHFWRLLALLPHIMCTLEVLSHTTQSDDYFIFNDVSKQLFTLHVFIFYQKRLKRSCKLDFLQFRKMSYIDKIQNLCSLQLQILRSRKKNILTLCSTTDKWLELFECNFWDVRKYFLTPSTRINQFAFRALNI